MRLLYILAKARDRTSRRLRRDDRQRLPGQPGLHRQALETERRIQRLLDAKAP